MIKFTILTRNMFLVMLFTIGGNCCAQNLVTSGSFTPPVSGWTFFAPATSTETYATETSYGGPSTTNVVGEVDAQANLRQVNIPVVAGQPYWLSFRRSRRTGAPNPVNINVKIYNGTNIFLNQNIISSNTTWAWTCETFQFTPTTNTVTLDIGNTTAASSTLGTVLDNFTITPVDQPIVLNGLSCQGGSITLNAPFSSGPDASYSGFSWTGPNGFTSTDSIISFTNLQPTQSGTYTCTMLLNGCLTVQGSYNLTVTPGTFNQTQDICSGETYNFYGRILFSAGQYDTTIIHPGFCDSTIVLQLNVKPKPDVLVDPSGNIDFCAGDSMVLHIKNPASGVNYQWYKNGNPISGETGSQYVISTEGDYKLGAELAGCSNSSDLISVSIHPLPLAEITLLDKDIQCAYDTVRLSAKAGSNYVYFWAPAANFRLLTGAESGEVAGIFDQNETKVTLDVYNEFGCTAADSVTVFTKPCCEVFVPLAFSPNADGLNDYFKPSLSLGQKILNFRIFDRYGKEVYKNDLPQTGWPGSYPNSEKANAGVYMYLLNYTCSDGKEYSKKGDVTLIR